MDCIQASNIAAEGLHDERCRGVPNMSITRSNLPRDSTYWCCDMTHPYTTFNDRVSELRRLV